MFDVIRQLQRWLSTSVAGIDSEDAKLVEAVSSISPSSVVFLRYCKNIVIKKKIVSHQRNAVLVMSAYSCFSINVCGLLCFHLRPP